jgi:glycosyltransferase involved in cell wall biosynthesis
MEAVSSVLGQDYQNTETIVVDDGSTDDTVAYLGPVMDQIVLIRQENRGVSAARNAGIRMAKGGLIAFLDSDDLWERGKLADQVRFFLENPETLICQTEEIWIRKGRRVNPMAKHRKPSGMIYEASLHLCLVSPSAVMIRRSLLDEVGLFDETLPACEDYDLWLRIGCRYPIYTLDSKTVVKRGGHADQLSRAPGLDRFRIRSIVKMLESGVLTPGQHAASVEVLKEKCGIYADGCRKRGKSEEESEFLSIMNHY